MQWVIFKNTRIILVSHTESCNGRSPYTSIYHHEKNSVVRYAPAERAVIPPLFLLYPYTVCTLWGHLRRFRLCRGRRHVLFSSFLIILFGLEYDRKGVRLGQSVSINTNPGNKPYIYRLRTCKKKD